MIELGDPVPLTLTITSGGAPADATSVVLTIEKPDGTTTSSPTDFTLAHVPASGVYSYLYLPPVTGSYQARFVATGINSGAWEDPFTVESSRSFISAAEASAHMRAAGIITTATDQEQLRWLCRVASEAVEGDLSRIVAPRTVVETFDGGQCGIVLRNLPVISITSVVDGGATLTTDQYTYSAAVGILYRGGAMDPQRFAGGRNGVAVTLRAGYQRPPMILRKVALNGVQRMWQASQQLPHPALDDDLSNVFTAAGILTPLEMVAYEKLRHLALA